MQQDSSSYAETAVTLFGLACLALGTLAMLVRFLVRRRGTLASAGRQFIADVKHGEGFSFHQELLGPGTHSNTVSGGRQRAPSLPSGEPRILRLREWLNLVNHHPDAVPHLFIEGGSGSGKTTLATAILHDRPGPIAIIGVKPDDGWSTTGGGYTYRSTEREPALKQLLAEVRRRLDDGDKSGLTLVLDDFTRLASDHPTAVQLYKLVADVGRSLRIRLVLIARGRQVKGIGAGGESDLLDHFVFITVQRSHQSSLEYDEAIYPLDTTQVRALAKPLPPTRFWQAPEPEVAEDQDASDKLLRLLGSVDPVPVQDTRAHGEGFSAMSARTGTSGTAGTAQHNAVPLEEEIIAGSEGVPATLTPEAIRTLYSAGWSKNRIAALLIGTKAKRLGIIDAALIEERETEIAS